MIAGRFGEGYNGPLIVTVETTQTTDILDDLDAIAARLADVDGVAYVGDGLPNETVDTAIIQVVPESAPPPTRRPSRSSRTSARSRTRSADLGTPIAVTGYTAVSIDISQRLTFDAVKAVRAHRRRALDHPAARRLPGRCSCRSRPRWASCSRRPAPSA